MPGDDKSVMWIMVFMMMMILQAVREIIGSYSGDIAGAMGDSIIDNYGVCANNNDDTGDVLNNGGPGMTAGSMIAQKLDKG